MSTAHPDNTGTTSTPHPQPTRPIDATKGLALFLNKRIPGQKLWGARVAPDEFEPVAAPVDKPPVDEIPSKPKIPPVSRLPLARARYKPHPSRNELQLAANAVQRWRLFVKHKGMARQAPILDERRMQRLAFRQWRQAYRGRHVEWRLEVKADVHLQYSRGGRALLAWRRYVELRRQNAVERQDVLRIAGTFRMRRTWAVWRAHIRRLCTERATEDEAKQLSERNSIRAALRAWRFARSRRVLESRALHGAVQIFQRTLAGKCLRRWRAQLQARLLAEQKWRTAEGFDCRRKCKLAISAWKAYVMIRQRKELQLQAGLVLRNRHLAALVLKRWLTKSRDIKQESEMEKRGADHYAAVAVKKWTGAWRERYAIVAAARMMTVELEAELDRARLVHILHSWKNLLRDNIRADKQYVCTLQKSLLLCWRRQAAFRTRSRELLEVKAGVEHFGRRLTAITFAEWKGFVDWQRTQRLMLRDADVFAARAQKARHFRAWKAALAAAVDDRMTANRGRALHDDLLLSRTLHTLRDYARGRIAERENLALAIRHRNRHIARTALHAWWMYADDASQRMAMWRAAVRYAYQARVARAWAVWRIKAANQHAARVKRRMAGAHAERVAARNCLLGWRAVIKARETFRALFCEFAMRHYGELLRDIFGIWRARLQERKDDKLELNRIQSWRGRKVAMKSLAKWREYVKSKVWQRKYDEAVYGQATSLVQAALLRAALRTWVIRLRVRKIAAVMAARADAFRTRSQLAGAFGVWRCLRAHRRWERKSARKAEKFRRACVVRSAFSVWHSLRADWNAIYTARVAVPIAFWGLKVSRKAFDGWRAYAMSRRKLRERVRDAMGWKNENALRNVAAQFLKCAQREREDREARALTAIGERHTDELKRVHRFALKWRAKTLASREMRKRADADRQSELMQQLRNEELLGQIAANVAQRYAIPIVAKPPQQNDYARSWANRPPSFGSRADAKRHRPPPRTPAFLAVTANNSVPYPVFFSTAASQYDHSARERSTSAQPAAARFHPQEQQHPPPAPSEGTRADQQNRPLHFDDLHHHATSTPARGPTTAPSQPFHPHVWATTSRILLHNENATHGSFPPAPTPPQNHQQRTWRGQTGDLFGRAGGNVDSRLSFGAVGDEPLVGLS
ncbi:hypothetical protein HDU87_005002 [Geranomyces variabilis]|uniref:Sfi1 spindle body domain-containing protein n=1 Tax=Geranomyces variabilis TaxID=109894 RepID=A0AAD5TR10_9FUNG|nr:hypothetical protein HDU87_005002 [Geranomyces variabilis]